MTGQDGALTPAEQAQDEWYARRNVAILDLADAAGWAHSALADLFEITPERVAQIISKFHSVGTMRRADRRDEYGQLMSGGGFLTRNPAPEIEAIYPLADWIPGNRRHGGRVYRRRIVVLDDWAEVGDDGEELAPDGD